jgi:hypothetical protein
MNKMKALFFFIFLKRPHILALPFLLLGNAIIKIPSAIITSEHNFLLNPAHPDARKFKILELTDFHYNLRIKE